MTDKQIFTVAIKVNGEAEQEEMAIEECAELIMAIRHKHRGRPHNIPEEIADVEICLEQLRMINNCSEEVERIRQEKVDRLYDNIFDKCL